jgi:hypothetical protein
MGNEIIESRDPLEQRSQESILKNNNDVWFFQPTQEYSCFNSLTLNEDYLSYFYKKSKVINKTFIHSVIPGYATLLYNLSIAKDMDIPVELHARHFAKHFIKRLNKKKGFYDLLKSALFKIHAISNQPEILLISRERLVIKYIKHYKSYLKNFQLSDGDIVKWIKTINGTMVRQIGVEMFQENYEHFIVQKFEKIYRNKRKARNTFFETTSELN